VRYKCSSCGFETDDYDMFYVHVTVETYCSYFEDGELVEAKYMIPRRLMLSLAELAQKSGLNSSQLVTYFCDTYVFKVPVTKPAVDVGDKPYGASVY